MAMERITISIDRRLLAKLDGLVAERVFATRSQAIQIAVGEMIARRRHDRLIRECAKLDPTAERAIAEKGMVW